MSTSECICLFQLPTPTYVPELRWFMGVVNQMSKFFPNITQISKPLRNLLSTKVIWTQTPLQDEAFCKPIAEICSPHILALFNVEAKPKVCAVLFEQ